MRTKAHILLGASALNRLEWQHKKIDKTFHITLRACPHSIMQMKCRRTLEQRHQALLCVSNPKASR
jgi:hypothetical protein